MRKSFLRVAVLKIKGINLSNYLYPATVESNNEGGFIARFRDVPEAITEAWNLEELKKNARDALISAIDFYIEGRKVFPAGSNVKSGDLAIELPASVVAKVLLLNTMVQTNVRPIDLARKMKIKPQEVTRLADIRHATKIDTIQAALRVLGKELILELR